MNLFSKSYLPDSVILALLCFILIIFPFVCGTTYGGSWHFRPQWLVLFSSLCVQLVLELLFPITATKPHERSFCEVFCVTRAGLVM